MAKLSHPWFFMDIFITHYYYFVMVFTALYSSAFVLFLSRRFYYSKPSRAFALFLFGILLWSIKDSLAAVMIPWFETESLKRFVIVISPLWLFIPSFTFHMLISVYNASVSKEKKYKKEKIVQYVLVSISTSIFLISMIYPSFMYRSFIKGTYDYYYDSGMAFALYALMIIAVALIPGVKLIINSLKKIRSEAFFVGCGALFSLAIIFPANIIRFSSAYHDLPRAGCLSIALFCAFTFYGIQRFGRIFSIKQVLDERDRWEKIGLSLKRLTGTCDEESLFQSVCSYAREISESLFVAITMFNDSGTEYHVRALSKSGGSTGVIIDKLPIQLNQSYLLSERMRLKQQIYSKKYLIYHSVKELFGEKVAPEFQGSEKIKQIVSFPIIYKDRPAGAIVLFRSSIVENIAMYEIFSVQCSLVLKFASQIKELDEKRKLAEQYRHSKKMEAIGLLAGGVAHDFNNLLSGISGFANLIKRKYGESDERLQRYIDPIIQASDRGAELTSQLLAFARKGKYQLLDINIHEIIESVIKLLSRTIDKRIVINTELNAQSPVIRGDPSQVQNAVLNMCLNSRDAMPEGGDLIVRTDDAYIDLDHANRKVYRMEPGNYLFLTISDTGAGMDEETRARMFEPFFTTKESGKGTGLGLAGVYGCVKSHNGYIEVESVLNKGTCIKTYFPAVKGPLKVAEIKKRSEDIIKGKGKILVVDDEEVVRDVSREILSDMGYAVTTCNDGREAVEYYSKHYSDIDLAIIDMIMPGMAGFDCFRELKKIDPAIKVIIATGYSIAEDTQKIVTRGISGFIQKPFEATELSQMISEILKAG
ncbi:MAG: response regulator [Chitinivibrionales bacterium]|nr:response regulator [Chitinivibrionales bacterium]